MQINSDASEKSLRGNQVKVNNVYEARISEEVAQSDYSKMNSYVEEHCSHSSITLPVHWKLFYIFAVIASTVAIIIKLQISDYNHTHMFSYINSYSQKSLQTYSPPDKLWKQIAQWKFSNLFCFLADSSSSKQITHINCSDKCVKTKHIAGKAVKMQNQRRQSQL